MCRLFNRSTIHDLLDYAREKFESEVHTLDADYVLRTNDSELLDWLLSKYKLDVPRLSTDAIETIHVGDTRIDVGHDQGRDFGRGGDTTIPGTVFVYAVPFGGDENLFDVQPTTFTMAPPIAEVKDGELRLSFSQATQDSAAMRREVDERIENIQNYLRSLRETATEFEEELIREIPKRIRARKKKLLADRKTVEDMGYPIRRREHALPNASAAN